MADASGHQEQGFSQIPPQGPIGPDVGHGQPSMVNRFQAELVGWFRDRFDPRGVTEERLKAFDAIHAALPATPQEIMGKLREPWRRISQLTGIAEVVGDTALAALVGYLSFGALERPSMAAGGAFAEVLYESVPAAQNTARVFGGAMGRRTARLIGLIGANHMLRRVKPLRSIDQTIFRVAGSVVPKILEIVKPPETRVEQVMAYITHEDAQQPPLPLHDTQILTGSSSPHSGSTNK